MERRGRAPGALAVLIRRSPQGRRGGRRGGAAARRRSGRAGPSKRLAVAVDPGVDPAERFGPQGVEPPLAVRAHLDDAGVVEDAQMARDAGLMDVHPLNQVAHRALADPHRLHDTHPRRVAEGLEECHLRISMCIYISMHISDETGKATPQPPPGRSVGGGDDGVGGGRRLQQVRLLGGQHEASGDQTVEGGGVAGKVAFGRAIERGEPGRRIGLPGQDVAAGVSRIDLSGPTCGQGQQRLAQRRSLDLGDYRTPPTEAGRRHRGPGPSHHHAGQGVEMDRIGGRGCEGEERARWQGRGVLGGGGADGLEELQHRGAGREA